MEYKITQVFSSFPSKYPDSKKYEFMVEGNTNKISAFSKFPMNVGDVISGEIVPNGQWLNFKWEPKKSREQYGAPTQPIDASNVAAGIQNLERLIRALTDRVDKLIEGGDEDRGYNAGEEPHDNKIPF